MKPDTRRKRLARTVAAKAADFTVVSDLPDPLPITEAELELLERELADFFAKLLRE